MGRPQVIVIRAPGINCEEETLCAWRLAGADAASIHLNRLLDNPACLDRYEILTLPGGFSYGDDVSAGRIFANRLMQRLSDHLRAFIERDRLILGICNGFQILAKAGLLTANAAAGRCTVALNASGRFVCRWVSVRCETGRCPFLEKDRVYFLPIAHAEGRVAVEDPASFDRTRLALRYVEGAVRSGPANPNGSFADTAALIDGTGRIMGMMPHPERFVRSTQHPFWTAQSAMPEPDGLHIFSAAVNRFRS